LYAFFSFSCGIIQVCQALNYLVESPQPTCNRNQTLNQKRLFLQKVFIDEVVGQMFLLKIRKIKRQSNSG
jgi:hypothetical protein